MQLIDLEERSDIWTIVVTSAGARGFATDQVTFDLLDGVRGQRPQVWEQTSDGGNVPRSCELAESPATTVPLYYYIYTILLLLLLLYYYTILYYYILLLLLLLLYYYYYTI